MKHPSEISIQDFTYTLPPDKIAVYPLERRDASKLLVFKDQQIRESSFEKMHTFLEKDSILVFNNAKVISARLLFSNSKQQAIEIFCLEPGLGHDLTTALSATGSVRWNCLVGNLKQWKDEVLHLNSETLALEARLLERQPGYVLVEFTWTPLSLCFAEVLQMQGRMPIPPYLKRQSETIDDLRYQTVYAKQEGSVAAPTAGLHFTEAVLEQLRQREINTLSVTLHVGAGTFKPVKSDTMEGHEMHGEWIEVSAETINLLLEQRNKKIIAVGTTSLRTLESLYWIGRKAVINPDIPPEEMNIKQWEAYADGERDISPEESLSALLAWLAKRKLNAVLCRTQLLIAPPYTLKLVSGLITNFHQPQSTLLLLISAVVGERWREIYEYALQHDFRFLSYGDSSLLLK